MFKIRDIPIDGRVILGPMAGVSTLAYREFMKPFGVALSYSEMISDCGLIYGNRLTRQYFATSKNDRPVGLQLFGFDVLNSLRAIDILEKEADYDILDINLGCPVNKVVKTGAGSAWLKRPEELYSYMRSIVIRSSKPVTAKIRLGWDSDSVNFKSISQLLVDAGVSMITIHARTAKQQYEGHADYELLRGFGATLPIPLCVSGDIYTVQDALKALDVTKASGVMVARGGVGNPLLVENINKALRDEPYETSLNAVKQAGFALEFAKKLVAQCGERTAIMQLRGLVPKFFSGFPGYKKIRMEIAENISSFSDLEKILSGIMRRERL